MEQKNVIALGFFDGVHLGHQSILRRTIRRAVQTGMCSTALTFDRHPHVTVGGDVPPLLTTLDERIALFHSYGIRQVIVLPFDEQLANTPAEQFITDILIAKYRCGGVVCGNGFCFGRGRYHSGYLEQLAKKYSLVISVCPSVRLDDDFVSSTRIRKLVQEGDMERAARLLGRPFSLSGPIENGSQNGRKMGFPTINTHVADGLVLPRHGVYATHVAMGGHTYHAVTNVGTRPTFSNAGIVTIESYLLDFSGNAYGEQSTVQFRQWLRDERPFSSPDELAAQISRDIERASAIEIQ